MSSLGPGHPIFAPARTVYERRRSNGFAAGSLSSAESVALILEMVNYRPLTTIIIDALDECDPRWRSELLEALTEILETSPGLIKILVSSRDDGDIVCHLSGCLKLTIRADNNQLDIDHFVDSEVDYMIRSKKLLLGRVSSDLRPQIKRTLRDQAHGMQVVPNSPTRLERGSILRNRDLPFSYNHLFNIEHADREILLGSDGSVYKCNSCEISVWNPR